MLDSCICVAENCVKICVKMIWDTEIIGIRQYANFKRNIFQDDKDIRSPIKQNKTPIFQFHTTTKKSATAKKFEELKDDVSLVVYM